ncbi:hypothetical protein BMS3Bbin09_00119 [bacterium BMS3Bbin09]|nr:hypothetical protein BMS3Bbin09_00119 [bacterium BMS3Bbin09]
MAIFKCESCGATKEGHCKPKECPKCGKTDIMKKQEDSGSGSGCGCSCKSK